MNTQLLNNEAIVKEVKIMEDLLTITDRRFIYRNTNTQQTNFIGLNQLSSAISQTVPVVFNKLTEKGVTDLCKSIAFIIGILGFVIVLVNSHTELTIGSFFMGLVVAGVPFGFVGFIIAWIFVTIYAKSTTYTENRIQLVVKTVDNKEFVNRHYTLSFTDEVLDIQNEINNLVYSK